MGAVAIRTATTGHGRTKTAPGFAATTTLTVGSLAGGYEAAKYLNKQKGISQGMITPAAAFLGIAVGQAVKFGAVNHGLISPRVGEIAQVLALAPAAGALLYEWNN
jgi:hypothetical protein